MRLKSLTLENITSLKGKHQIDFDKIAEFSELFAITGPTGSGKSSILTAVSMAIYGDHPKGLTAADLITTGEAKGEINLTFSKGGDLFEVHWSCQVLKKNGEPRKSPLTTRVVNKNGIPTEEASESIIGLSFDQFSKVVILNQGQFSEFLNSTFTQRKDLLENILNQHDFKSLAPFLKRKVRDLQTTIEQKEGQGELTMLMEPEQVKEYEKELKEVQKKKSDLEKKLPHLKETKKILKELRDLSSKNNIAQINLNKDQNQIEELLKELTKVKSQSKEHKIKVDAFESSLKSLKPKLERSKKLVDQKTNIERDKEKNNETAKGVQLKLKELEDERESCKEKIETLKTKIQELEKHTKNYGDKLDRIGTEKLREYFTNAKESLEKLNIQKGTVKHTLERRNSIEQKANESKDQRKRLVADLDASFKAFAIAEIDSAIDSLMEKGPGKNEETLPGKLGLNEVANKLQRDLEARNAEDNEIILIKERIKELELKKDKTIKDMADLDSKSVKLIETRNKISKETSDINEKVALLEKSLKGLNYLEEALEIINEDNLETCPVCDNSINKSKIEKIEAHLKTNNIGNLQVELKQSEDKRLSLQKEEVALESQINAINENNRQNKGLLKDIDIELNIKGDQLSLIERKRASLKVLNQSEITNFNQFALKIETIDENLEKLRKDWHETNGQYKSEQSKSEAFKDDLSKNLILIKNAYPQITSENLKETYQEFQELQKILHEKKLLLSAIEGQDHLIKKVIKQISEYDSQKEKLGEELKAFEKELVAIENEFQIEELPLNPYEIEAELTEEEKELKRVSNALGSNILEKEVAYEKKNAQINLVKEQIQATRELIILYKGNLKNLISIFDEELHLDEEDFLKGLRKTHLSQLEDDEQVSSLTSFLDEVALPLLSHYEETYKDAEKQSIVIETQLAENQKQLEKLKSLKKEIIELKKNKEIYERLSPFLLKDAFRDFALEVLEEGLLQMANNEISSLAEGRYELVHGKAGKRRELLVKDKWQGHNLRKVSTLSGGETFLLSLGLALGLSEMTRGQTEVESFFIDEGFGTLDGESISQVLDCLMKMQSRGKQVGLISHVKALTDQIPVRLELEKNNFGESQIELR